MSQGADTTTSTRKRSRIGRVAPLVAVAAVLAFAPTVAAKGQLDGWHWNDLPWAAGPEDPSGVTGDAMADACQQLPRIGVERTADGVVLDFTDPSDGLPVNRANAWFDQAGVDVEFGVDPSDDAVVGGIRAHGGFGDVEGLDVAAMGQSMGRPQTLLIPESFQGAAWFTLTCRTA